MAAIKLRSIVVGTGNGIGVVHQTQIHTNTGRGGCSNFKMTIYCNIHSVRG